MPIYPKPFEDYLKEEVSTALRILLSEKHLYQSTRVGMDFLEILVASEVDEILDRGVEAPTVEIRQRYEARFEKSWILTAVEHGRSRMQFPIGEAVRDAPVEVELPTIHTSCAACKGRWPFNPRDARDSWETGLTSTSDQWFHLSYRCQNCKCEPIRFLVRRKFDKLILCGREPMESVEVPPIIPRDHRQWLERAVVAAQSGQALAAIFLLRVFVEQFWRSIPEVNEAIKDKQRPTGDELGTAYKSTLPEDFKTRFPTLCEVYDSLSRCIHSADESFEAYEDAYKKVIRHFDARRLYAI